MTLKETTVDYCNKIIDGLQTMIDAKSVMDEFLGEDDKRREAFKTMVEFDPVVGELFKHIEELTEKLEM